MRKKNFTKQLAVSVSDDLWEKILESTDREEISFSNWIRQAIQEKLAIDSFNQEPQKNNSRKG